MVAKTKKKTARKSAVKRSSPGKKVVALHPLDRQPHPLSRETQARDEKLSGLLYVAAEGDPPPVPQDVADLIYGAATTLADAKIVAAGYANADGSIPEAAGDSAYWQAWYWHFVVMLGAMPEISGLSLKFIAACKKKAG